MQLNVPEPALVAEIARQALFGIWESSDCCPPSPPIDERDHHVEFVARTLCDNLSKGRCHCPAWAESANPLYHQVLGAYAARVAGYYWEQHLMISRLCNGDAQAWEALRAFLTKRAFYVLYKRAHFPISEANGWAQDYAHEACKRIIANCYPCDVPFDAWTTRILYNCIHDGLDRSPDLLDSSPLIDEDWGDLAEWNDGHESVGFASLDDRLVLRDAIAHIPQRTQRLVIILTFFYGWSAEQIAQLLDRTPQAVYNLRNRAIVTLRKVLRD